MLEVTDATSKCSRFEPWGPPGSAELFDRWQSEQAFREVVPQGSFMVAELAKGLLPGAAMPCIDS